MPIEVEIEDQILEFPDEMTQDEIRSVLQERFPSQQQAQRDTRFDFLGEPLPAPARSIEELTAREMEAGRQSGISPFPPGAASAEPTAGLLTAFGLTPEMIPSGRRLTEMITGISPQYAEAFREEVPVLRALDVPLTIATSAGRTAVVLADYMTSPQGLTELAVSLTPAKVAVFGKWAVDMAKGAGQSAGELDVLLRKENKTPEDYQKISDLSVNTAAQLFGAGHISTKGVKTLSQQLDIPLGDAPERVIQRLSASLEQEPQLPIRAPQQPPSIRQIGIPQASLTAELFLQPGVSELAGAALREAQGQRLEIPGEMTALERLRMELEPPQITLEEPARLAERISGGGEAPYGRVSYMREAEAPTLREMRPIPSGFGKEITAPSVETVRAQRALEARQKGGESSAIQRQAETVLRPLRQSEVTQEGAGRMPADQGRPQTTETRQVTPAIEKFIQDFSAGERLSTNKAIEAGLQSKSIGDLDALLEINNRARAETKTALAELAKASPEQQQVLINRIGGVQFPREAIEGAVNIGGNAEGATGIRYGERPLDWRTHPEVKEWIGKNAEKIWTDKSNRDAILQELKSEPEIEVVTPLEPSSGRPLTGIESLINRLESLKFPEAGEARLYSLPHPDALKAIGRTAWNGAVDVAIASVKAGKAVTQAVDDAIGYLRKNVKSFNEDQARANIEYITKRETEAPKSPITPESPEAKIEAVDPVTGEKGKLITDKAAKAMEKKVSIPAQKDVSKLSEQIDLFNREIGDALESGGQFLPKELRPEVAKGAPAERATVTNKEINQYFVNKLSSIRKQLQATKNKIAQQADVESQVYFDLLQKRFEQAFQQVQELRRASHEALYFWNKIRAEYQDIARAANAMPEMKKQMPILDQIWKDIREGKHQQAGRHLVDYLRMNLFTLGSWTLDFGTNLVATGTKLPTWAIMDLGALVTGRPATRMVSTLRALADNTRNWNPLGKRFRLPEQIESELGTTAGGELGRYGREVLVDFSEILKSRPELAERLRHIDKLIGAPIRMKRAVDSFFGRFGATAELYNRAYVEGKTRGLAGDDLKQFVEDFVQNPSEAAIERALKTGKELKFNRDLTKWEESFASNTPVKLFVEAFPRWTLQFIRWGGEMIGANPVFFRDFVTGKATPEQTVNYLVKAATGWAGIYAFNQLFYDNIDANSMEYVKEDGDRIRLAGRTPAPELFFITALLRGDSEKAKAALAHLSVPGAKLLSGEPAGIISPLIDTIRESIRGRYTAEMTARELTKLVNDAIPGKSVLGLIRSLYDPTIREGIGAPIPGVASLLPQKISPTTGEPLAPKQRIPGTKIEIPTVGGTPFPGAVRVLNDIESTLMNHGLGLTRPRRTSIIELPAEDVPKEIRREYETLVGKNIKRILSEVIYAEEFKTLPFDARRAVLQELMEASRTIAKAELAEKHGTSMRSIKSEPLNIQRMPKRLRE